MKYKKIIGIKNIMEKIKIKTKKKKIIKNRWGIIFNIKRNQI
jgi:hypothetical protein